MEQAKLQHREGVRADPEPPRTMAVGPRHAHLAGLAHLLNAAPAVQRLRFPGTTIQRQTSDEDEEEGEETDNSAYDYEIEESGEGSDESGSDSDGEAAEKPIADYSESDMDDLANRQPELTPALEAQIRKWMKDKQLSAVRIRYWNHRLEDWKNPEKPGAKRKARAPRSRDAKRRVYDVYSDSDSDLSTAEPDFDLWSARKPLSTTSVMNRSHVPTQEDIDSKKVKGSTRYSGMHHSNTYLMIKQGGHFVPRTIRGKPNVKATRKRLPEDKLVKLATERDQLLAKGKEAEARAKGDELTGIQNQLIFGNTIDWDEGEYDADAEKGQEKRRADLDKGSDSAARRLIKRGATGGVRSGSRGETHKDAEQRLLSSKVWKGMTDRLMKVMHNVVKDPIAWNLLPEHGVQIMLNRSSCLGCGKALTLALIHFWEQVREVIGLATWQQARDHFAGLGLFRIGFPVIYEYDKEKSIKFANLDVILAGMMDAGWQVQAPRGIESNAHAEENHQALEAAIAKARKGQPDPASRDASKASAKPGAKPAAKGGKAETPNAQIRRHFRIGEADGEGNDCLLNTVYQLTNNTENVDPVAVHAMRATLVAAGVALQGAMIDLYGGAGMQLANDLHIRIQVIQIRDGRIVNHPTLGTGGPLIYILHTGRHFSPLWRR